MSRINSVLLFFVCLVPGILSAAPISLELQQRLTDLPDGQTVPVIIQFGNQTDLSLFTGGRDSAGHMIDDLKTTSLQAQATVRTFLSNRGMENEIRTFWINNSMALQVDRNLLAELALYPEIESIDFDEPVGFAEDFENLSGPRDTYWNLDLVNTPDIWAIGHDGSGIVVGSMDTGVDPDHPALAGKWRGGTNSWKDLVNNQPNPYDDHGHGTHTIGTMVGGDGPGPFHPDIGVAYGALYISAKVLDHYNSFSSASIVIAGAQWMLDPDGDSQTYDFPHVINNSWYFYSSSYTGFYSTVEVWRAAGIIPVFCLGNEGPNSATTRPPGSYSNVLGIGAITASDNIWTYSSRGPSPTGYAFPDDFRKPDLCAPGASVNSCLPGGGYSNWSGTSMATPHVAGTVALILQIDPYYDFTTVRDFLITTSVDHGSVGFDMDYGYGRLDVYAAVVEASGLSGVPENVLEQPVAKLDSNFPNPFNPSTNIRFTLFGDNQVSLKVFSVDGRAIATLVDGEMLAGNHEISWRGVDHRGEPLPSGMYFYQLVAGDYAETRGMTLIK